MRHGGDQERQAPADAGGVASNLSVCAQAADPGRLTHGRGGEGRLAPWPFAARELPSSVPAHAALGGAAPYIWALRRRDGQRRRVPRSAVDRDSSSRSSVRAPSGDTGPRHGRAVRHGRSERRLATGSVGARDLASNSSVCLPCYNARSPRRCAARQRAGEGRCRRDLPVSEASRWAFRFALPSVARGPLARDPRGKGAVQVAPQGPAVASALCNLPCGALSSAHEERI